MGRNMRRLRMDDLPGPYYLAYTVREGTQAFITASFGALEGSQASPFLEARVQVRVGDDSFDNTNFVPAGFGSGGPGLGSASFEDDYDNLRFSLWSLTDDTYKNALEAFAKKKAFRERHRIMESPGDFSREQPVERYEPSAWVPMKLPCTTLPTVPGSPMERPSARLPEMRLPAPMAGPPMKLVGAPYR